MQPVEARKGISSSSQLLDSLKVYLNNKDRLQPIIGLGCIVECVKAGTHSREALYLCEACVCRLSKADIRNHITGSLHRYNYITARHPHLVSEWSENTDMSKLAWPLMDKAKILEGKEGPGHVQLLEVEDAVYQMMSAHSENDAVTLISILRGELDSSETTPVQPEHCTIQSQRIVLFRHNQEGQSEKSLRTSAEMSMPPSLIESTVAPSLKSKSRFNMSMSRLDSTQMSSETSALSEHSNSFLDGYTGAHPLIGLSRMVECRSEDGHTYCLLCHCCRIRFNKKDVIDHLTSSSHLVNYLMETRPEQMEVLMADLNDNYQFVRSLAKKAEHDEGRGELKVVNAPESLCILLTGKSYHWCVKMLCNGWTNIDTQKRKIPVKGPSVNKTSNQGTPVKCAVGMRMTGTKKRKKSNTVFVSLPLTEGYVLLERTSFSKDSVPVSPTYSPPSDSDLIPSEFQSEDCALDCETQSFAVDNAECTTSQLQQGLYSRDTDTGHFIGQDRTFFSHQEVDGYFRDNENFSQSKQKSQTKDPRIYWSQSYNKQHDSQERLHQSFDKEWQNEDPQTQNEWVPSAVPHTQDWPSYHSSYGRVEDGTELRYNPTPQVAVRVEVSSEEQQEMAGNPTQHYNKQQPQYQYMAQDHASAPAASVRQRGLSGEMAPHLDAAWINIHPHLRDSFCPQWQHFAKADIPWQTYTKFTTGHFQTASQSSTTQQAIQVDDGVTSNSNYDSRYDSRYSRPMTKPDHVSVLWTPR